MTFIDRLKERDPGDAVAFHLEGLLDAADGVRGHLEELDQLVPEDPARAATILAYLEVEIYTHLFHHLKELRRPLKKLAEEQYQRADLDS